jgi:hypothetical protein
MILILIFGEALALYGLIVSLILSSSWLIQQIKHITKNWNMHSFIPVLLKY